MKICPHCGARMEESDAMFCTECASPLTEEKSRFGKRCPSCGAVADDPDATFCVQCAQPLSGEKKKSALPFVIAGAVLLAVALAAVLVFFLVRESEDSAGSEKNNGDQREEAVNVSTDTDSYEESDSQAGNTPPAEESESVAETDEEAQRRIVLAHFTAFFSCDEEGFMSCLHPDMIDSILDHKNMTYDEWMAYCEDYMERKREEVGGATISYQISEMETRTDRKSIEYWFDDVRWDWGKQNATAVAYVCVEVALDGVKLSEPVDVILAKIESKWYVINTELA